MKMYFVCTSLPFPSTGSLLLLLLRERETERDRERDRERESINFTYPRDVKATTSQPKYQVVDKNLNGRGAN